MSAGRLAVVVLTPDIAATAIVHGMTVVTGNVADFEATGVGLINPWIES